MRAHALYMNADLRIGDLCYLDENGHMVYDTLVDGVYYVDSNGYWVI